MTTLQLNGHEHQFNINILMAEATIPKYVTSLMIYKIMRGASKYSRKI